MAAKEISINELKRKILPILKSHGVKRAGIFGSFARGEQKKGSDVDVLIKCPKGLGFGFAGIQIELEEKIGKKVHLLTYQSIYPRLKNQILNEEVRIL